MKPKKYIEKEIKHKKIEEIYSFINLMLNMSWSKSDKVYYRLCLKELNKCKDNQ